jgi:hypothetical protein
MTGDHPRDPAASQRKEGLTDLSPAAQDLLAVEILRSLGVINKIKSGDIGGAIGPAARLWAALFLGHGRSSAHPPQPYVEYEEFLTPTKPPGDRKMKLRYALIIMVAPLTLFPASARFPAAQSKIPADADDLRMRVGESFLAVRARILRSGWQPIRMHINDDYEYFGAEKALANRKFLEVDSCSMDAGALCILYYEKGPKCLRVDTVGEQINEMTVTRWTDECPG